MTLSGEFANGRQSQAAPGAQMSVGTASDLTERCRALREVQVRVANDAQSLTITCSLDGCSELTRVVEELGIELAPCDRWSAELSGPALSGRVLLRVVPPLSDFALAAARVLLQLGPGPAEDDGEAYFVGGGARAGEALVAELLRCELYEGEYGSRLSPRSALEEVLARLVADEGLPCHPSKELTATARAVLRCAHLVETAGRLSPG